MENTIRLRLQISLVAIFGIWVMAGMAQGEPTADEAAKGVLQADLSLSRHLFNPNLPIVVRFTLLNTSDEVLDIPLQIATGWATGISLPLEIVFGSESEPALRFAYRDEQPAEVSPPTLSEQAEPVGGVLRLAPHGSVGCEVNLRDYIRYLRYAGTYRLEWRPLGGRAGTCSAEFQIEARKNAILVTDMGKITFPLMYDQAPRNVENFLELVRDGFYDGKVFHRVIPGFLLQGGCPKGDGTGTRPDGKLITAEFHYAPFQLGTLAMARKPSDPDSSSCQFFISLARLSELDGQYSIIGQASDEESLRTLSQMAAVPTDKRDRPRIPLVIRSINLVDAEESGTVRLQIGSYQSDSGSSAAAPSKSEAKRP